jgi:hypothetical protein
MVGDCGLDVAVTDQPHYRALYVGKWELGRGRGGVGSALDSKPLVGRLRR